ncbi:MAG: class I SAM-dependent methyltransferase [Alphaproteobacteria bacterium]|nr:class I SAM-dependent methyltransferase [Alphaproteobacteria bacterium]
MLRETVHSLVAKQFGPRAAAYVASAVHAKGEDLDELADFTAAQRFDRALDLGCGGGHVSFALAPRVGAVVAYDLSDAMLAAVAAEASARGIANLTTCQGAVEALPFEEARFDLVASRYSAHHWRDVPQALAQARRVLKPGGALVMMDAVAPDGVLCDTFVQTIEMLRDPSHVRDYSVREWLAMLAEAGFDAAEPKRRRIRLEFANWIARMQTPPLQAEAIRALMARAPAEVTAYFAIESDGSFMLDAASIVARSRR